MPTPRKPAASERGRRSTPPGRFREEEDQAENYSPRHAGAVSRRHREEKPEEETPRSRGASSTPPSRRSRSEPEPPSRRPKKKTQGWAAVVDKKEEMDAGFDDDKLRDFFLMDGETAIIQYIDEEPYAFDAHRIQDAKGKYLTIPCQLEHQKHCLCCRAGERTSWQGAARLLDYRGKWDKDKKEFKWDAPQEKLHSFGIQFASQLKAFVDKRRRPLTDLVIEITKAGSGKTATYNLAIALDEDDRPMRPVEWDSPFSEVSDCLPVKSDEELEKWGY